MKCTVPRCLLAFLMMLPSIALAQQVRVVRVGVVVEQYLDQTTRVNWTENARWQRDLLVTYLNQHKPPKAGPFKLQAVPLTTMTSGGIEAQVREMGCEYVVQVWYRSSAVHGPEDSPVYTAEDSFQAGPGPSGYQGRFSYSVGYLVLRGADNKWLAGDSYTQFQPQSAPAMLVMSSVYDAIVKAATP